MKKLIRDNIPEIMKSKGLEYTYYVADELEYNIELLKKIVEESLEVQKSNTKDELIEELADVIEVVNNICKNNGITNKEIENKRLEKLSIKGGFMNRYIYKFNK